MIRKYFIIIILLFAVGHILGQHQNNNISPQVIELFRAADSVSAYYDNQKGYLRKYSDTEVNYFIKVFFDAHKYPADYKAYMRKKYLEFGAKYNYGDRSARIPGFKLKLIKDLITQNKGEYFTEIIGIPYFLKIKVLRIDKGQYVSVDKRKDAYPTTILVAEIEDVLKGSDVFSIKDTVNVTILDFWMYGSKKTFIKGEEYFVPLRPLVCKDNKCKGIALKVIPKGEFSVFPIEHGRINIANDYFHLGSSLEWDKFKMSFLDKFIIK